MDAANDPLVAVWGGSGGGGTGVGTGDGDVEDMDEGADEDVEGLKDERRF
ncbi:hypothetical protein EWM64_g6326 [Hericium alpestre]|uniref:Uncharacterized protein n=1 Tax=Hericium alpestre TaxID=135208 RepID=A0A4Y9ZS41_9AGAM|nr:hypothetical protein EWM64_g6326 [Hericium alpestre]